jgi:hypothetical protein
MGRREMGAGRRSSADAPTAAASAKGCAAARSAAYSASRAARARPAPRRPTKEIAVGDTLTWFVIAFLHGTNCPGKCEPIPALTIQMPDAATCQAVKKLNADQPLECWARPAK